MIKRVLFCLLLLPVVAHAGKMEVLDSIAAVVNDDVIMQSELKARMDEVERNLNADGQQLPPSSVLQKQVLDRMIEERLQMDLAKRMGIHIDDTSLNEALTGIARQNKMSLEQFADKLRGEGMDWGAFREQIRQEMAINQVRQRQVGQRIHVTEREVDRFLDSELGKQLFENEFHLGHILIQLPDGATPDQVDAAEKEANSLVAQLKKGADFKTLAISHSDGPQALKGGDLGWRPAAQWPSLFSETAVNMQPGDIAGPLRSGNGFHIIKMIDRKGDAQKIVTQYHVRHILIKPSTIRSPDAARDLARSLRQRVLKGESMDKLAREYSDDPGSARNGGDLNWVSTGQMVPEFDQQMTSTPVGTLSPVFQTQFGWHFLRVEATRNQDMSEDFRRLKAKQALQQRRYSEELETWLREIRDEAYVDIRV